MHTRVVYRLIYLWVLLIVLVALFGDISVAANNAGTTAADFLLIGVGAGAAGMGGAYSAVSQGASAVYWNPAGLAGMERAEVSLSHYSWYQDINLEHGAIAFPISDRLTVAASVTFLDYGVIEGYDINGASTGEITAYDWTGGLSLGYAFSDAFSFGVTGKFVNEKIAEVSAASAAADFGLKYQSDKFAAALVVANVGQTMKFEQYNEKLPTAGRVALAFKPFSPLFMTSVEVEKRSEGDMIVRHGVQLSFMEQYFLRGGYNYYPNNDLRPFGSGISLGAGIRLSRAALDYAYSTKDSYTSEDLHRFSLTIALGK